MTTKIKNVETLSALCDVAEKVHTEHCPITQELLDEFNVSESFKGLRANSDRIYDRIKLTMALRTANSVKTTEVEDTDDLTQDCTIKAELRQNLNSWFSAFGKRKPRGDGIQKRPLYSVTYADYETIGYCAGKADEQGQDDIARVYQVFFELMFDWVAHLLLGEPYGKNIVDEDLAEAEKAHREAMATRAKKAKETRKTNEQKKAEEREAKREEEKRVKAMEKELATLRSNISDTAKVIEMIQNSHATAEEKQAIINALNGVTVTEELASATFPKSKIEEEKAAEAKAEAPKAKKSSKKAA